MQIQNVISDHSTTTPHIKLCIVRQSTIYTKHARILVAPRTPNAPRRYTMLSLHVPPLTAPSIICQPSQPRTRRLPAYQHTCAVRHQHAAAAGPVWGATARGQRTCPFQAPPVSHCVILPFSSRAVSAATLPQRKRKAYAKEAGACSPKPMMHTAFLTQHGGAAKYGSMRTIHLPPARQDSANTTHHAAKLRSTLAYRAVCER